jgi:diaminohydroxyphosphoribosylaminopyrimidine deaminase/5-amino-6-(5-phosphoribosylamino)uracil reductase
MFYNTQPDKMKQSIWKTLLQIAVQVSEFDGVVDYCCFKLDDADSISINDISVGFDSNQLIAVQLSEKREFSNFAAVLKLEGITDLKVESNQILSSEEIILLNLYLPYCFLSVIAKQQKRTISIAHFAQSLDGKLATRKGDSRWIGNDEHLKHAHRMRALCDAIIIGKNTLANDLPRLTVRKVEGENPTRVIIGSANGSFKSLTECCSDPIIVIGKKEASSQNGQIQYHQLKSVDGKIKSHDILNCLFQQGIKTVYIEGGAITTSNFLNDGAIDVMQLHLSPYLFGSGKQGIVLPNIDEIDESIQFQNFSFFTVGDSVMFVGQPK